MGGKKKQNKTPIPGSIQSFSKTPLLDAVTDSWVETMICCRRCLTRYTAGTRQAERERGGSGGVQYCLASLQHPDTRTPSVLTSTTQTGLFLTFGSVHVSPATLGSEASHIFMKAQMWLPKYQYNGWMELHHELSASWKTPAQAMRNMNLIPVFPIDHFVFLSAAKRHFSRVDKI